MYGCFFVPLGLYQVWLSFNLLFLNLCSLLTSHPSSTIITIAHRLNTVLDYDRILVLKAGAIAELDTPRFNFNIYEQPPHGCS